MCKSCRRLYNRKHYENNKDAYLRKSKVSSSKAKDFIRSFKESNPCKDCGHRFHFCQMDFDHVRGSKIDNIGSMVENYSIAKVMDEIKKCDLVCANCHRLRTYTRLSSNG